jgi:hypothetical protein
MMKSTCGRSGLYSVAPNTRKKRREGGTHRFLHRVNGWLHHVYIDLDGDLPLHVLLPVKVKLKVEEGKNKQKRDGEV